MLGSAGGAFYYKGQSVKYETLWGDAMEQLAQAIRTPAPAKELREPISGVSRPAAATDASQEKQIAALLAELAAKDEQIIALMTDDPKRTKSKLGQNQEDREKWFEDLKQTDPDKYNEIIAQREEKAKRVQDYFSQKAISLMDRDTSTLSKEEYDRYNQMLNDMNTVWTLAEKMSSPDTPRTERRVIAQELRETSSDLKPLLKEERDRRLIELGVASGYSETEAEAFMEYIDKTIEATTLSNLPGKRGGGRKDGRDKPSDGRR